MLIQKMIATSNNSDKNGRDNQNICMESVCI